jgi:hypothetical protein
MPPKVRSKNSIKKTQPRSGKQIAIKTVFVPSADEHVPDGDKFDVFVDEFKSRPWSAMLNQVGLLFNFNMFVI